MIGTKPGPWRNPDTSNSSGAHTQPHDLLDLTSAPAEPDPLAWELHYPGQEITMREYLFLLLGTALVNNVVLVKFLGLCPFIGVSKKIDSALGMGLATTFVLTITAAACWAIDAWVLAPFGIGFLRILSFILIIASVVQFTEMVIRKTSPDLYQVLGIYLPLITTNCAVLGIPLLNVQESATFVHSLFHGFGSGVGFTLVLVMFAGLRERLALASVPAAFAGAPISFILASLLSLAFMGFAGLPLK
jgi:Na+-translocating ferredoxin:NAD+ oxidoreductase subunit A